MNPMLPIIIDTDPGIGYFGRDVDDGLAIIALLQDPSVNVLGLTITFGNVSLAKGLRAAKELTRRAGRPDLPILAGASSRHELDRPTEASAFLLEMAAQHRGALA